MCDSNRYTKQKVQVFDLVGCGNAIDTTVSCQMIRGVEHMNE